ncbi:MAG: class I mannose-6-phosphate isomerase [Flavobacteriaceae bacterium]|nr:class I mannose-6-phosphate isomerase [Flavobacteriaceae bacterium]
MYPLKFTPIFKHKIWGGTKLEGLLNKEVQGEDVGESWEISGVQDNISVVANGFLAGNDLEELIEIYMGDLVGDKVYDKFGLEFPLLLKFIDANAVLSVQVHPNDEMAKERHHSYGKTEMWYVMQAEKNAELIIGFNQPITKEEYVQRVAEGTLQEVLNRERIKQGDAVFIPAGRVHAIGEGILLAEIQQTSDITYRIFDWNRVDDKGKKRDLHTELALEAIDFVHSKECITPYEIEKNKPSTLVDCPYFTVNLLELTTIKIQDYSQLDSFVIFMCVEGSADLQIETEKTALQKGDTVLIPALLEEVEIQPKGSVKLLEIYIS